MDGGANDSSPIRDVVREDNMDVNEIVITKEDVKCIRRALVAYNTDLIPVPDCVLCVLQLESMLEYQNADSLTLKLYSITSSKVVE